MQNCPLCGDARYATLSSFAKNGHRSQCMKKKKQEELRILEHVYYDDEGFDEHPALFDTMDFVNVLPIMGNLCVEFLRKQNLRLHSWGIESIKVGHCLLLNGDRKLANLRSYFKICKFVTHCHGLSPDNATDMITLWKQLTHINGKEIPMPAKYSTIQDRLLSSLDYLKISYKLFSLPMPSALFGEVVASTMPNAEGLIANILDIAGKHVIFYLYSCIKYVYIHVINIKLKHV